MRNELTKRNIKELKKLPQFALALSLKLITKMMRENVTPLVGHA